MSDERSGPAWLAKLFDSSRADMLDGMSNRDLVAMLVEDLDYESQLAAIRELLTRNTVAEAAATQEIDELQDLARAATGVSNEILGGRAIDGMHQSVYRGAAHSMAAVGMLAPFLESLFSAVFRGLRDAHAEDDRQPSAHSRWLAADDDVWDCHFAWHGGRRQKNVVEGVLQLSEAVGLSPRLPSDLRPVLEALFGYRNKMFHFGFEWPPTERERFLARVVDLKWPTAWFATATTGGAPWCVYLTDEFVSHCLATIDAILDGIGLHARELQRAQPES